VTTRPPRAITLRARGPFRLAAVAVSHGWFQTAPFEWDGDRLELSRRESLDDGAVTVVMSDAAGGVAVRPSAALSPPARARAIARVRRMLQLDADLEGFLEAAREVEPALADDLEAYGGGRVLAGPSLYEDVVKSICGTNVTWRQAVGIINRIASLGPHGAFPTPPDLLRAGDDWLRAEARVGYRAGSILAAARSSVDGTLAEIEHDSAAGDSERVYAGLLKLAGVGPATAGFILMLMGHFDRPSVDAATLRIAAARWFGGRKPTAREVLGRLGPAGPFSGLVLAWATMRRWQRDTGLVPE
jgi:3-methyladenine DNA glycosylase/8-oxoguanine DNA glycosylase